MQMKLGKRPAKKDPKTFLFSNYFKKDLLPTPPASINWGAKVTNWLMFLNDSVGDCTVASAAHLMMEWTANGGKPFVPADADILAAYEALSGYDPASGINDNGAVELDVLNYWRTKGIAGHQIMAFAALEENNPDHVRAACYLFGGCYIGLALPTSAQNQDVWDAVGDVAGSWGGHAVPIVAYNETGPICVTWGALKQMTWKFYTCYCDEAFAILGPDWASDTVEAPSGFDLATLKSDLSAVSK